MHKSRKQRKEEKRIRLSNKKLVKEYPFLRPRNVWTGKFNPDYNYEYTWLMEGGWKKLQVDLCRELKPLLIKANYLNKYQIVQIKEKYAELRWYDNGVPDSIWEEYTDLIDKYEVLSMKTCLRCGKPAKICNIGGWIDPYCKNCMKKIHDNYNRHRKEPIEFNYEDYLYK